MLPEPCWASPFSYWRLCRDIRGSRCCGFPSPTACVDWPFSARRQYACHLWASALVAGQRFSHALVDCDRQVKISKAVKINVLLFGTLQDIYGVRREELTLPE